ncbi:MAG: HAMP domain-containing sensor histidine kinase [Candidatus Spechtbacterales bacterium]
MLITGWPTLFVVSVFLVAKSLRFYRMAGGKVWGKLVLIMVLGWMLSMYSLGILATIYMLDDVRAIGVVLPFFVIWVVMLALMSWTIRRWGREALVLAGAYGVMEKAVRERTRELNKTTQALIKRDEELIAANQRLRQLDELKSQFVAVAAHQLRTPLTEIRWTFNALVHEEKGTLNAEQKKITSQAHRSTLYLIDLVSNLLDVSRMEEGMFGFVKKEQLLVPVVEKVCASFARAAERKKIHFETNFSAGVDATCAFDADKMAIAISNVVDNAIKYTPEGGSVTVSVGKENDRATITVADTGIGLPAQQAPQLFSKFFRAKNAQRYQTSGTGLGLYLTKNIIEHHGGTITFTSQENKGSTFTISLPLVHVKQ